MSINCCVVGSFKALFVVILLLPACLYLNCSTFPLQFLQKSISCRLLSSHVQPSIFKTNKLFPMFVNMISIWFNTPKWKKYSHVSTKLSRNSRRSVNIKLVRKNTLPTIDEKCQKMCQLFFLQLLRVKSLCFETFFKHLCFQSFFKTCNKFLFFISLWPHKFKIN